MRVLMIHEMNYEIMDFLEKNVKPSDVLTFDDGLYSQWLFQERILALEVECIFYISTGAVRASDVMPKFEFPTCEEAMERWTRDDDRSAYMSWSEIEDLMITNHSYVGGHGHDHVYDYGEAKVLVLGKMTKDYEKMRVEFAKNLRYTPALYCFPYNKTYGVIGRVFCQKMNLETHEDRIDIRELMGDPGYELTEDTKRKYNE